MKKVLFLFFGMTVLCLFFSCYGGAKRTISIIVAVKVLDEKGLPVSESVFENLNCSYIRRDYTGFPIFKSAPSLSNANYCRFTFSVYLGESGTALNDKKLRSKYLEKLSLYGIQIADSKNFYQTIVLNPLPLTGFMVKKTDDGYPSYIEYFVQLKK